LVAVRTCGRRRYRRARARAPRPAHLAHDGVEQFGGERGILDEMIGMIRTLAADFVAENDVGASPAPPPRRAALSRTDDYLAEFRHVE
jgi:hypothetical protein